MTTGQQVTVIGDGRKSGLYGIVTNATSGVAVTWQDAEAVRSYMSKCTKVMLVAVGDESKVVVQGSDHDKADNGIIITVIRSADDAARTADMMRSSGYRKVSVTPILN